MSTGFLEFKSGHADFRPEQWFAGPDVRQWFAPEPDWHWIEPSPVKPAAGKARTHALDEVRLFWPEATLHVIREEQGGCRWAYWCEVSTKSDFEIRRKGYRVLLRKDLAQRFARVTTLPTEDFHLIEYREASSNRLIAWNLKSDTKPGA